MFCNIGPAKPKTQKINLTLNNQHSTLNIQGEEFLILI